MSRGTPARALAAALVAAFAIGAPGRAAESTAASGRVESRGSLAWLLSDDLDLVGDLAARVWLVDPHDARVSAVPFVAASMTTAILRSIDGFTFAVRDLPYDVRLGAVVPGRGGRWVVAAGDRGRAAVDADGWAYVRFVGLGWESSGFDERDDGEIEGRGEIAAIVTDRGVEADARIDGALRWSRPVGRVGFGLDATLDALVGEGGFRAEWTVGPRLDLPFGAGRRCSLFVRLLRSRHPLGLATDGTLVGFEVEERAGVAGIPPEGGDVRGSAGVGAGANVEGRLYVAAVSPRFAGTTVAAIDVDARARRARDTGDLYYRYTVGFEHLTGEWRWGGWFYHRSGHALAEPNPEIASFNILEGGAETASWDRAPSDPIGRRGRLDARIRAGYVVDASDEEAPDWNLRGGLRWIAPAPGSTVDPYLAAEFETGHARMIAAAAGILLGGGFELRLEWRRDAELLSEDDSGWSLWGSVRF